MDIVEEWIAMRIRTMGKYTIVTEEGKKIVAEINKHHTALDFIDEVFKWVGRGTTVTAVYHHFFDEKGNEKSTKVK